MNVDWLDESITNQLLKIDDLGWSKMGSFFSDDEEGPELSALQSVSEKLRDALVQPLPKRGNQLRHAYIFGRGMVFNNIRGKPRVTDVIEKPHNKSVLFSVDAYEQANSSLFTDGIFCVVYDTGSQTFTQIPLSRIQGIYLNPNDPMDIWAIQLRWNNAQKAWIRLARNIDKNIELQPGESIVQNVRAYIKHTNRQSGWSLGVPDSLAGHIWVLTYNAYLRDSAELVHALSKIAWKITTPNAAATHRAAGVVEESGGVGGIFASSGELNNVGVPSSQVDFNKGQPLAAMVASSYGVPVIAILSSPGATGGSYGAAQTLDAPTTKGFEAVQDSWVLFYSEILSDLGAKNVEVSFPTISNDPEYRQVSSIAQAVELGVVWPDEARIKTLDLLNLTELHKGLPPKEKETETEGGSVVAKRGAPAKGAAQTKDNPTNHDNDDKTATGASKQK